MRCKQLCYLLGAIRDGSLPICGKKKEITLATDPSVEWLKEVAQIASEVFSIPLNRFKIYEAKDKKCKKPCYRLKLYSAYVYKILSKYYEPGDQGNWKTPKVVFPLEYIAGFYDAEGGCRNSEKFQQGFTKTIHFWASIRCKHNGKNEPLLFIQKLLKQHGIVSHIYDNDELVITGKENLRKFYSIIPLKHPRKTEDLRKLLIFTRTSSADA